MKPLNFKILIVMSICLICYKFSFSEVEEHTITLRQYEITDSSIVQLLDSFLVAEQICSYYTDSLNLSIDICDWNGSIGDSCKESDTLSFTISSIIDKSVLFHNALGYFKYKNHLIVISNLASTKFFKVTDLKKTFHYFEEVIIDEKGQTTQIPFIEDDSYTYWTYKYVNGVFFIDHEKYNCPTRRKE